MNLQRMYDAADRAGMLAIKRDHGFPFAVASYNGPPRSDNRYVTTPDAIDIFYPHSHIVGIAVHNEYKGTFLDVEKGDATPDQALGWLRWMISEGVWRPGIYANKATMPSVKMHIGDALPRSAYRLWVADWTGSQHLPSGYEACQYTNNASGGHDGPYDSSVLDVDTFFPKPKKSVKPHPKVVGAAGGAAVTTAVLAILHKAGITHLTPLEIGAINSLAAAVSGWTVPSKKRK